MRTQPQVLARARSPELLSTRAGLHPRWRRFLHFTCRRHAPVCPLPAGAELVRINLSEQTDMMDLLGADLPVAGGAPGEFAWCVLGGRKFKGRVVDWCSSWAWQAPSDEGRVSAGCNARAAVPPPLPGHKETAATVCWALCRADGPLLSAVKSGAWVLLDELNLAGQTVLEGLNAVLDHRAEVGARPLRPAWPPQSRLLLLRNTLAPRSPFPPVLLIRPLACLPPALPPPRCSSPS